jgi:hypothetical protein
MSITGVVKNGKVEFDIPGSMPEGTRVELDYAEEDMPIPPPTETRAQWLASLKQAYDEAIENPKGGMSLEECMSALATEFDLKYPPQE